MSHRPPSPPEVVVLDKVARVSMFAIGMPKGTALASLPRKYRRGVPGMASLRATMREGYFRDE